MKKMLSPLIKPTYIRSLAFIDLSTNFYNRVYEEEEEWFGSIFGNSKKEDAIQNQYEYFIERMGGPPLSTQRRGHPFSS
ncbi:hypothetical protein ACS0TY_012365 [Phlomoides rotata]